MKNHSQRLFNSLRVNCSFFSLVTLTKLLYFKKEKKKDRHKLSYMTTQHIQTDNRSFSSIVIHKALHRSIFQIQVLRTCLHKGKHKGIREGEQMVFNNNLITRQHAGKWHRQNISWERLTSSGKWVWWLKESLIQNRKAVCTLERAAWLFGLVFVVWPHVITGST